MAKKKLTLGWEEWVALPGLEGIEQVTGKNIAGMIIEYVERHDRPGKLKTRKKEKAR